jgi:hypothetical protein
MIVGRGEVKSFLFDRNEYTIETAKQVLKEVKCNYEPTLKQYEIEKHCSIYKKRLKTVRRCFKNPDEIDDLKISFDDKYRIFEFDSTQIEYDKDAPYVGVKKRSLSTKKLLVSLPSFEFTSLSDGCQKTIAYFVDLNSR